MQFHPIPPIEGEDVHQFWVEMLRPPTEEERAMGAEAVRVFGQHGWPTAE